MRAVRNIVIIAAVLAMPLAFALARTTPVRPAASLAMLRAHVKYVFIIYQENHTFDNYFGTFPGADNLATAQAQAHGYRQWDPIGKAWVTPFLITDPDTAGASQAREVVEAKMDAGKMDRFVAVQEQTSLKDYSPAGARSVGLITMSHYDCDTIPYLWKYARTFALYDHIFQGMTGPSTPGNIEIIAAQAGQSQAARFPADRNNGATGTPGDPIYSDIEPAFGPYEPGKSPKRLQLDQKYATLMLLLGGTSDAGATQDTQGVRRDLHTVADSGRDAVPWGWYQEGYNGPDAAADKGYESHHNAPQYFGYLRKNDVFWSHEHNLRALLAQLRRGTLPARGVFYIKGGSRNQFGWKPVDRDPAVQRNTLGDDDHPGVTDSDHEVGEAFVATFVNAIARSKYWHDAAIIITWDDAGGYYDHVPPPSFERCSDGKPCGDGPRVPFILLSPYAKSGAVIHDAGDTSSVVKFAEAVFGLPPLASLPDEKPFLPQGPRDGNPELTNLLGGFDPERLAGTKPPIPATAAQIPDRIVNEIPTPMNCRSLAITPVRLPASDAPPPNFEARPQK
ncbi:MAG TPA: alkaline phosphatase family protein [Candidatus Acidoferrales bacterium]|nr:alkaline phosphatase family protein [Candidatus Acidoferrales bacterium]